MAFSIHPNPLTCACQNTRALHPQINVWNSDITSQHVILRRGSLIVVDEKTDGF